MQLTPKSEYGKEGRPLYLQYLGGTYIGGAPYDDRQEPQVDVRAWVPAQRPYERPATPTYEWEWDDSLIQVSNATGLNRPNLQLRATKPSSKGAKPLRCKYTISTTYRGLTVTGSCYDDTATSRPYPGAPYYLSNIINVHKPDKLELAWSKPDGEKPGPSDSYVGIKQGFLLKSHLGVPMPGVMIQERFLTEPPSDFPIETSRTGYWLTKASGNNPDGKPAFGCFDPYWLRYRWTGDPSTWKPIEIVHEFWAGTMNRSTNGIKLATYKIVLRPGKPGQMGKVEHKRIS